jgi:ATP-dependent helicase/nuclease subunit A
LRNPLTEPYPSKEEGARAAEAMQFADKICEVVGHWQVHAGNQIRAAQFGDIMVLVRRRTHLKVYEQALRARHIPYLTSRRGGLLDTLEASDIQSLLTFLITPFADLQLAHTLRSPIFSCSDHDLMLLGERGEEEAEQSVSWWSRLQRLVATGLAPPTLLRAQHLLQNWLTLADILPVHDLLDRIYFEGDVQARYRAAMPEAMRETVSANLQALLEMALNVDAGRYPSLPGFLRDLAELRKAEDNDAPDEGKVSQAGNALRIYTVHEAKGLEAPLVWLLDSNAKPPADKGYDALVDWPTGDEHPAHFSLYADKASRGAARENYFSSDAALAQREDLNLLYVAMTRAKQALLVSGSGERVEGAWYERIAHAQEVAGENPLPGALFSASAEEKQPVARAVDDRLKQPLPVGARKAVLGDAQRYGVWLHGLMQYLTPPSLPAEQVTLQQRLNIPAEHMPALWQQAHHLLRAPHLQRLFDASQYLFASNELDYIDARGELRRIDRLVEFEDEVWVLDYKTGSEIDPARHTVQMEEYRAAMRSIYPGKKICCALIDSTGKLLQS